MILYVLALFSLILIVPIVYFLPLGFTKKGKWWIIGAALFTSVCGLLTQRFFAWWQTVLLMLLFLIVFTYIFIKKSPEMIFEAEDEEGVDDESLDWEMNSSGQVRQQNARLDIESDKLSASAESEAEQLLTARSVLDEEDVIIPEVSVEEEFMKSDFSAKEDVNNFGADDEIIIEKLAETEEIPEMDVLTLQAEDAPTAESFAYMKELERLMISDESEKQQAKKQEIIEAEYTAFDISLLEDAKASLEVELEADTPVDKDWTVMDKIQEQDVDDFVINPENLELDAVEKDINQQQPRIEPSSEIFVEVINEEDATGINEKVTAKAKVAHQVINNTLMQLELMKNTLRRDEYEAILLKCLTDTLPLHEYFALANLLIEHYVQHHENSKLESWFIQLQIKYQHEPIILEQLNFMEKNYLMK